MEVFKKRRNFVSTTRGILKNSVTKFPWRFLNNKQENGSLALKIRLMVFTWLVRAVFFLGGSRISVVSSDGLSSSGVVARCCLDHSMSFALNNCSSSTIETNSAVSMNIVFKTHATHSRVKRISRRVFFL